MSKIRIPVEKLPPPDIYGNHTIQFRIVSEDRNKLSAWSPLYTVKSLGQYRPLFSNAITNYSAENNETFTVTWDTATYYNYDGSSSALEAELDGSVTVSSASIVVHNHSQNFKQHSTDIFLRWYNGTESGHFEYHDRVITDNTSIVKSTSDVRGGSNGPTHVEILGLIATYGLSGIIDEELDSKLSDMREYLEVFSLTIDL
jgi:hypothetical protein